MKKIVIFSILSAAFFVVGCSQDVAPETEELEARAKFLPPSDDGVAFEVPSHPTGQYRLLKWSIMKNGHVEAVIRSDSPTGGTTISIKEIDCKKRDLWLIGQHDNEEKARAQNRRDGVYRLVEGSIQDVSVSVVCREAKR